MDEEEVDFSEAREATMSAIGFVRAFLDENNTDDPLEVFVADDEDVIDLLAGMRNIITIFLDDIQSLTGLTPDDVLNALIGRIS